MEFTFRILFWMLEFVTISSNACADCLVTRLPNFENHLVLDYQLWSRKAPTPNICYKLCHSDSLCISFHYNTVSELCRGYFSGFTSPSRTQTTNDIGNNLFLTCKATHRFGAPCSHVSDCHDDNNTCIDGACQCMLAYKYSTVTWSCYQYYLGCYQDDAARILPYAVLQSNSMTNEICVSHCRENGYSFAGTQFHSYCFCGNVIKSGYSKYDDSRCNTACQGDNAESCGGAWAGSIYSTQQ